MKPNQTLGHQQDILLEWALVRPLSTSRSQPSHFFVLCPCLCTTQFLQKSCTVILVRIPTLNIWSISHPSLLVSNHPGLSSAWILLSLSSENSPDLWYFLLVILHPLTPSPQPLSLCMDNSLIVHVIFGIESNYMSILCSLFLYCNNSWTKPAFTILTSGWLWCSLTPLLASFYETLLLLLLFSCISNLYECQY